MFLYVYAITNVYAQNYIVVAMDVRLDPLSCSELKVKVKRLFKYNTRNFTLLGIFILIKCVMFTI